MLLHRPAFNPPGELGHGCHCPPRTSFCKSFFLQRAVCCMLWAAHGELWPHFNFRGVTFKLSVTTLSLEFFIAGIFVLLLEKLSNPRKHAVWNDLMLLEVFPFFFSFLFCQCLLLKCNSHFKQKAISFFPCRETFDKHF